MASSYQYKDHAALRLRGKWRAFIGKNRSCCKSCGFKFKVAQQFGDLSSDLRQHAEGLDPQFEVAVFCRSEGPLVITGVLVSPSCDASAGRPGI